MLLFSRSSKDERTHDEGEMVIRVLDGVYVNVPVVLRLNLIAERKGSDERESEKLELGEGTSTHLFLR